MRTIVHNQGGRVNVRKEDSVAFLWLDVYTRISKVCMAANFGDGAVENHRRHAIARLERQTRAVAYREDVEE